MKRLKNFCKTILNIPRQISYYFKVVSDFNKFRRMQDNERFQLSWKNRKIYLGDQTESIPFDRHYVYHTAWAARKLKKIW